MLRTNWPDIREELLTGRYRPSPVRKVIMPKPDGSQRELGIPMVLDRLIQQALLQVLQPLIDPSVSESSHLRHCLRAIQLMQWKWPRTIYREIKAR